MKKRLNYYLIVTTSTEVYPTSPFTEFNQPPQKVKAKFCIETTRRRLTDKMILKGMEWLEDEFNLCFEERNNEMRVTLDKENYTVYILPQKPNNKFLLIHI